MVKSRKKIKSLKAIVPHMAQNLSPDRQIALLKLSKKRWEWEWDLILV